MTEDGARMLLAVALDGVPRGVLDTVRRLRLLHGDVVVADAIWNVWQARTWVNIRGQVHGTTLDKGGAEARRSRALARLDDAIGAADSACYRDSELRAWLQRGAELTRDAARKSKATRGRGRPGIRRPEMELRFKELGCDPRDAEAIVSAIRGDHAVNVPSQRRK